MKTKINPKKQGGFVLVVAMIVLAVVSLFAIQGMGMAGMSERLAGNYTDRARAMAAAEQAIAQAEALLQTNGVTCLQAGCTKAANIGITGLTAAHATSTLPTMWPANDSEAANAALVSGVQGTGTGSTAKYLVTYLSDASFAKTDCQPYNIMARGVGLNSQSVVVLQTISYLCATE
jgi:type IV pilus assembly protein PilX